MTRDEFLAKHWKSYPQPPAEYFVHPDWKFGKIQKITDEDIIFQNKSFVRGPAQRVQDPYLGASCSTDFLRIGDSVAYSYQQSVYFLLSPNLTENREELSTGSMDWNMFLQSVNDFFLEQSFKAWKTSTLVPAAGIDAHIDFMCVQAVRTERTYFLPASPELELKKAIVNGAGDVYEIRSCFRDDDPSPHHKAEFTMIEWYRSYADKWSIYNDFCELIKYVHHRMNLNTLLPAPRRMSIQELFRKYVGMDLTPRTSKNELLACLQKNNIDYSSTDDWDDLFFRLYIHYIEPQFIHEGLVAVYNFPATQGSLARITDEGWADRFEIYWQGVELANAYQEQNNPHLMEVRYLSEIRKRESLGRLAQGLDVDFLEQMKKGFPPCAGVALGLDRLWMILQGRKSLTE